MKKQIKIQDVKFQQHFFTTHSNGEVTEHIKYSALHRDCYPRIKEACFGLGVSGPNKNHICVFEEYTLVDIKVPNPKYRDIGHNERFKWMGNEYLKIDTLSEGKLLYFAINLNSGTIVDFSRDDEVERV